MLKTFEVGGGISEAGRVSGVNVKKIRSDMKFRGYTHHATREVPQPHPKWLNRAGCDPPDDRMIGETSPLSRSSYLD